MCVSGFRVLRVVLATKQRLGDEAVGHAVREESAKAQDSAQRAEAAAATKDDEAFGIERSCHVNG